MSILDKNISIAVVGASSGVYRKIRDELHLKYEVIEFSRFGREQRAERVSGIIGKGLCYYETEGDIYSEINKLGPEKLVLIDFRGEKRDSLIQFKDFEDYRIEIETNLIKKYELCARLCRYMLKKKWGRIIHFGSIHAKSGISGTVGYTVSKYGQIGLSKVINAEYNRSGITSNIIDVGYMEVGMFLDLPLHAQRAVIDRQNKPTSPDGIIKCIDRIICDASVKGQEIQADE
jgi:NAD(P)-dependent dehydrogenase (short-subunit alcohol dehydrogenase family)